MLKTYKTIQAQDREKIGIPKTAQASTENTNCLSVSPKKIVSE